MCECQTCGADENENDLNEWGECWKCADVIDTLIESVCDGVEIPQWEFEL